MSSTTGKDKIALDAYYTPDNLARAVLDKAEEGYKRCAVEYDAARDGCLFWSPRLGRR